MKKTVLFFVLTFLGGIDANISTSFAGTKTIHILVALCDNRYQGIVPVSQSLGNGQNPSSNLYWGAAYGIKTFFKKQPEWQLINQTKNISPEILERIVFKHKSQKAYLIADAYDGQFIRKTTEDLFLFSAGQNAQNLTLDNQALSIGGGADYLVYVGHNGLMDFSLTSIISDQSTHPDQTKKSVAVFACKSQQYFSRPLKKAGALPGLFTTQFMAPEAYSVHVLIDGWLKNESPSIIHQRVAKIYSRYQKLKSPALKLFSPYYSTNN